MTAPARSSRDTCELCGLPLPNGAVENDDGEAFCCTGCREVRSAIEADNDVDEVDVRATEVDEDAAIDDGRPPGCERAFFGVDGMHCTTCERFVERVAASVDGVSDASASYVSETVAVDYDPDAVDPTALPDLIGGFGYRVTDPTENDRSEFLDDVAFDRYRTVVAVLSMMPVLALYLLFVYPTYLGIYPSAFLYRPDVTAIVFVPLAVWSTIAVAGLGYPFFRGALVSVRVRRPNADLLIALAVLAAYAYSLASVGLLGGRTVYFDVAVMILAVVTIGTHVERRLKRRVIERMSELTGERRPEARRLRDDGSTEVLDPDDCEPDDRLLVRPGERVPVDGTVADGRAAVDESLVTGESVPRSKEPGDAVLGGSTVTDGALVVEVGPDASSTFDRLVEFTRTVRSSAEGIQRHVDRFAVAFVPFVVLLAVVTAAGWIASGRPPGEALLIGVSVLVISCPCSLGIATPLAVASGVGAASEEGLLVRNSAILERVPDSDVVVFDKTGTLTTGSMTVVDVDSEEPEAVLERAAAVERRSSHPVGTAIRAAVDRELPAVTEFERRPRAVAATVDDVRVTVGHRTAFADEAWTVPARLEATAGDAYEAGELPVLVGWDGRVRGVVRVRDTPRPGWRAVLSALDSAGRRIVVLTGDDERMARPFAEHPAVTEVLAGVRPEAKTEIVRRLRDRGPTTMIGDGTNDAAALAAADLGIALADGTDATVDAADVVVTTDDLRAVPTLFDVADATRARLRQNLGWALAYNAIAIPLAVAGVVNPLVAAALMATSSLLVVANSRRPLR